MAVSTFDEAPDQNLYTSPKSYGWQFVRWIEWPKSDDVNEYATFEVTGQVLISRATVAERKYLVRINKAGGTIEPLEAK